MKTKILIVEDNQEIIAAIRMAFQMHWPEVELVSCRHGRRGIELAESDAPDVVILDLDLPDPDMDGYEVIEHIRLFSAVPVLVLGVRDEETDIAKAKRLGANEYVVKPFKQSDLLLRLRALVLQ